MTKTPVGTRTAGQGCPASQIYDRGYFESDDQTRGYRGEGYRDFAVHYATASEILKLKPKSVIEIGAGRGYISKILKNNGIEVLAVDVSPHCWHTRALGEFALWDITKPPWKRLGYQIRDKEFDLCFSIATLEHIPEKNLDAVIKEMARISHRGLHAPSLPNPNPPEGTEPDKSHETLHPREWWERMFFSVAPNYEVTIVDKEDLEFHGDMSKIMPLVPRETRVAGEGGVVGRGYSKKINFGSFVNMFYYGVLNIDAIDMDKFALGAGYTFLRLDVSKPLPLPDGYADYEFSSHLIEHLSREEGARFIKECFRTLRPGGVIRIATPNVGQLMEQYQYDMGKYKEHLADYKDSPDEDSDGLKQYRHVNVGVGTAETPLDAFAHLVLSGHKSVYDMGVMYKILAEAGFENITVESPFHSMSPIMEKETIVSHPTLSLTIDAVKPMPKKKKGERRTEGKKRGKKK